ncbi:rhodanese-like domain-containing protein, partial [Myxococcota bacterium]|nr:rhodanese-like domain-containing protein [Myxococcota bacterium]
MLSVAEYRFSKYDFRIHELTFGSLCLPAMQIDSHRGSDGPTAHAICAALVLGFGLLALACDTHDGGEASISNGELAALIREGQAPLIVDVRTPHEYEAGHLPGAVHIPYDELSSRMS